MCEDIDTINYRLDIIDDIISNSTVAEAIDKIYSLCCEVEKIMKVEGASGPDIQKLANTFKETDIFGNSIARAKEIMLPLGKACKAEGLRRLMDEIIKLSEEFKYNNDGDLKNLEKDLHELGSKYMKLESITVGINLDNELRPMEATIVSINEKKYTKAPFLNRIVGLTKNEFDVTNEIHSKEEGKISGKLQKQIDEISDSMVKIDSSALQLTILSDLEKVIKNASAPLRALIKRYLDTYLDFFIQLKRELLFYMGAVRVIKIVGSNGMPMCRPIPETKEERICEVKGLYNLNLALRVFGKQKYHIVKNDLRFSDEGNIFVLTGPNSGGKTTFINALALIQVLFQAGMYVPAEEARLSPVDNIYTHFSTEEKRDTDYGRLGEESKRLGEIFKQATKYSLIILNESLASTSPGECLIMSKDVVYGLKYLGAKAIFATHQHELGSGLEEINKSFPGDGKVKSLVLGLEKQKDSEGHAAYIRTYKVTEAPPEGSSYAKDIAESFGISYDQIVKSLDKRFKG